MPKRKMRRYLRRPTKQQAQDNGKWKRLYKEALDRAEAQGDPRTTDLKHYADDPERALRALSIISQVDLEREFPG